MNSALSSPSGSPQPTGLRKRELLAHVEASVDEQERWRKINEVYYSTDLQFMRFLIPPGKRVLELGCGRGDVLAALDPAYGVGIDFSSETIARATASASRTCTSCWAT